MELNYLLLGECQECYVNDNNQYLVCHTPMETHDDEYDSSMTIATQLRLKRIVFGVVQSVVK